MIEANTDCELEGSKSKEVAFFYPCLPSGQKEEASGLWGSSGEDFGLQLHMELGLT